MSAVSSPAPEKAQKIVSAVLQRLQQPGKQAAVAAALGLSDATISRLKTEHLDNLAQLLAALGLKVVPVERVTVQAEAYAFLTTTHERVLREAPHLAWQASEE